MSDIAIRVEGLSKQYRLGEKEPYKSIRDVIMRAAKKPLSWLKNDGDASEKNEDKYFWALDDVSFEVKRGEALGIIGPNGAGKSTLLKILSGITKPTRGYADIYGRVGSLLEVGTGFHPELTGRENIYLNGAVLGMRRYEIDRKFDEIVDFSGVETYLDTPVKRYSSGMYVRLAFAVAAHLEPEILLVDEVLAVGDAEFQKKCLGKMGDVAGEGRTVVFVSHNMATIEALCKKCIYLNSGQIKKIGNTQKVIDSYLSSTNDLEFNVKIFNGLIKWIKTINYDGKECKLFKAGNPLRIKIFINTEGLVIENPVIGIGVNNSMGTRIFTVGTYFTRNKLMSIQGKKIIDCYIPNNLLVPGSYFIKVALGQSFNENIEEIENAAEFIIEPSDFFGNGKLPNKNQGFFLVRSDWEIINE